MNETSTPASRFDEVTAILTRVAASLGMTFTFDANASGFYRHGKLAKDGMTHEIVVETGGIQFRKNEFGRRGLRRTTTALSEENVRHHLTEVLAIMTRAAESKKAAANRDSGRSENIAKAKVARERFVADINGLGVTSDAVRSINFREVRDETAFGPIPHFEKKDDGSFGVAIFRPGRVVFSIAYTRAEMAAQFSADSAAEAVRIIKGFDALFAK